MVDPSSSLLAVAAVSQKSGGSAIDFNVHGTGQDAAGHSRFPELLAVKVSRNRLETLS